MAERKKPLINLPVNPRTKEYIAKKKKVIPPKTIKQNENYSTFPKHSFEPTHTPEQRKILTFSA